MSINVDILEHPRAGMYYVVYQHNLVYEMNSFSKHADSHCVCIGELWPAGEEGMLNRLKFGQHLRLEDVPQEVIRKAVSVLNNKITNV